jgi:hypothetical protein
MQKMNRWSYALDLRLKLALSFYAIPPASKTNMTAPSHARLEVRAQRGDTVAVTAICVN